MVREGSVLLMEILFGVSSVIVKSCRSRWIRGVSVCPSVRRDSGGGMPIKPTQKFAAVSATRFHVMRAMPYCGFLSLFVWQRRWRRHLGISQSIPPVFSDILPRGRYKRGRERRESGRRCQAGSIATRDRDVEAGRLTNGQKHFPSQPLASGGY